MAISKKLKTGTVIRTWNYEEGNCTGQGVAVKDKNGDYPAVLNIESVVCAEGTVNRVVIKMSKLKEMGWVIIEE